MRAVTPPRTLAGYRLLPYLFATALVSLVLANLVSRRVALVENDVLFMGTWVLIFAPLAVFLQTRNVRLSVGLAATFATVVLGLYWII
jgi:hypothetical protein